MSSNPSVPLLHPGGPDGTMVSDRGLLEVNSELEIFGIANMPMRGNNRKLINQSRLGPQHDTRLPEKRSNVHRRKNKTNLVSFLLHCCPLTQFIRITARFLGSLPSSSPPTQYLRRETGLLKPRSKYDHKFPPTGLPKSLSSSDSYILDQSAAASSSQYESGVSLGAEENHAIKW